MIGIFYHQSISYSQLGEGKGLTTAWVELVWQELTDDGQKDYVSIFSAFNIIYYFKSSGSEDQVRSSA